MVEVEVEVEVMEATPIIPEEVNPADNKLV
jgi:hypothetical protein